MPKEIEGQTIRLTGTIIGIPKKVESQQKLVGVLLLRNPDVSFIISMQLNLTSFKNLSGLLSSGAKKSVIHRLGFGV